MSSDRVDKQNNSSGMRNFKGETENTTVFLPSVYEGGQFFFIDVSPGNPFEVVYQERAGNQGDDSFEGKQSTVITEPMIFSKYRFSHLKLNSVKQETAGIKKETDDGLEADSSSHPVYLYSLPHSDYNSSINLIITDKKIYKPGEKVRAAVFAPSFPNETVELTVRQAVSEGESIYKEKILLNSNGAGFCSFSGMESGEYELILERKESKYYYRRLDREVFSVAEYGISLLDAQLVKYSFNGRKLSLRAELKKLNSPYSGFLSLFICDNRTGMEIQGKELSITGGTLRLSMYMSSELPEPFHVKLITEEGDTAEIHLPSKPEGAEDEISLGKLGKHFTASIHPVPRSNDLGWFNYRLKSKDNFPLMLQEIYSDKAVLHSVSDVGKGQIVLINPIKGDYRVFNFENITAGEELSFEIDFPYSVIHAAVWGDKPMESWGIVFRKSRTGLEMETPDKIEPGQKMTIKLKSSGPVTCLLKITDSRIESEDLLRKTGSRLYGKIAGYDRLLSGEVKKTDNRKLGCFNLAAYINSLDDVEEFRITARSISEFLAYRLKVIPILQQGNFIVLAMENPDDLTALKDLRLITGYEVVPVKAKGKILKEVIDLIYGRTDLSTGKETVKDICAVDYSKVNSTSASSKNPNVLTRSNFPDVIHFEILELDGTVERTITAGDQSGTWKCSAFAIDGFDLSRVEKKVPSIKECFVEIDSPAATGRGDEIAAGVQYNTGSPDKIGILKLTTPSETVGEEVKGEGTFNFIVTDPGDIRAEIESGEYRDRIIKNVKDLHKGEVMSSCFQILKNGESIREDYVEIFPSLSMMIEETVDMLLKYPFGCSEQTSSKLYALSVIYEYALKNRISKKPEEIGKLIESGIKRLDRFFHPSGFFSMWKNGPESFEVTVKVLENLILIPSDFAMRSQKYLKRGADFLKEKGYRNNRFLPLDKCFLSDGGSLRDMANFCIYRRDSDKLPQLAERIKELMQSSNNGIYWHGAYPDYWAGNVEATCEALTALWVAGERKLCLEGIKPVIRDLKYGILHSTSDTAALLRLLDVMDTGFADKVEITRNSSNSQFTIAEERDDYTDISTQKPQIIGLSEKIGVSGKVRALDDNLLIKTLRLQEVDYLDVKSNFTFTIDLSRKALLSRIIPGGLHQRRQVTEIAGEPNTSTDKDKQVSNRFYLTLGQRAVLTITPQESTLCPFCRILLPGNLALMKSGGSIQHTCIPIKQTQRRLNVRDSQLKRHSGEKTFVINSGYELKFKNCEDYSQSLILEIAAVRKGRGKIFVVLSDMYDSEKKGVNKGIEVIVE